MWLVLVSHEEPKVGDRVLRVTLTYPATGHESFHVFTIDRRTMTLDEMAWYTLDGAGGDMMGCDAVFETTRLYVRKLAVSDFDAFHEMQSDLEVMRFTTGSALGEAENRRQLKMCMDAYACPGNNFWVWAIVRKSDGEFIGTCAVAPNEGRPEIGYRLLRKFFGNGYGQEICNGLIDYAKHEQGLPEIIAFADVRNVASVRILDRSSLDFVGEKTDENGITDRFYRWVAASHVEQDVG